MWIGVSCAKPSNMHKPKALVQSGMLKDALSISHSD